MDVPLADLGSQHREIADEVGAGFAEVVSEASFINGKRVATFAASPSGVRFWYCAATVHPAATTRPTRSSPQPARLRRKRSVSGTHERIPHLALGRRLQDVRDLNRLLDVR